MEVSAGVPIAALALDDRQFSDVTLVADDTSIPAHRIILSRISAYFARAFTYDAGAREHRLLLPPGLAEHLNVAVRYCYGAICVLSPANVVQLLLLSDRLMISPLYSSCLAYLSIAVRNDADALLTVLGTALRLDVPLVLDVCTHAALTSAWPPLVDMGRRRVADVMDGCRGMGPSSTTAAAPRHCQQGHAPWMPITAAAALLYHQSLAVLRALPDSVHPTDGATFPGQPLLPLGAAGAAVVASTVASQVSAAPSGAAARALLSGGVAPPAASHGGASAARFAGAGGSFDGGRDADSASRHWLRSHLSGLLRTSAAFPRRVRGDASRPTGAASAAVAEMRGSGGDRPFGGPRPHVDSGDPAALWLATADAETDRLAAWQARQQKRHERCRRGPFGAGAGSSGVGSDSDVDAASDDEHAEAEPHLRQPIGKGAAGGGDGGGSGRVGGVSVSSAGAAPHVRLQQYGSTSFGLSRGARCTEPLLSLPDLAKLRSDVSDLLWAAYSDHVIAPSLGRRADRNAPIDASDMSSSAPKDRVTSFLSQMADVLALATLAPVLRGGTLWSIYVHALGLLGQPMHDEASHCTDSAVSDGVFELLEPLSAALAVAFGSPAVRSGIATAWASSSQLPLTPAASSHSAPRSLCVSLPFGASDTSEPSPESALVPTFTPPIRSVPLPRVSSSGSLGSDAPGSSDSGREGSGSGDDTSRSYNGEEEGASGEEERDAQRQGSRAQRGDPLRQLTAAWAAASRTFLTAHLSVSVLTRDELCVRSEDEVVGFVMDVIIGCWLGTPMAGLAVMQARAASAASRIGGAVADASRAAHLASLRRQTGHLWRCIRWEYCTPTAVLAAGTAVQLLSAQGSHDAQHRTSATGAGGDAAEAANSSSAAPSASSSAAWCIEIGIDGPSLMWAYDAHRLGLVVTTPAMAIAVGLRPPRLSYASQPRPRLLEQQQQQQQLALSSHVAVDEHPFQTDARPHIGGQDAMHASLSLALLPLPARAQHPTSLAPFASLPTPSPPTAHPVSTAASAPVRIVFGAHALLTYPTIPLLMDWSGPGSALSPAASFSAQPAPARSATDAPRATDGATEHAPLPSAGGFERSPGFAVSAAAVSAPPVIHGAEGEATGPAAAAQLAGASPGAVSRLQRVQNRRRRARYRAGSLDYWGGSSEGAHAEGSDLKGGCDNAGAPRAYIRQLSLAPVTDATPLFLPLVALPLPDASPSDLLALGPPALASHFGTRPPSVLAPLGTAAALVGRPDVSSSSGTHMHPIDTDRKGAWGGSYPPPAPPTSAPSPASTLLTPGTPALLLEDRPVPGQRQKESESEAAVPVSAPSSSNRSAGSSFHAGLTPDPAPQQVIASGNAGTDTHSLDPVPASLSAQQQLPRPQLVWPPSPAYFTTLFTGSGPASVENGDEASDPLVRFASSFDGQRLRDRAAMVRDAYNDIFNHISVRRGWRALPFSRHHVQPVFEAAAEVVTLIRHFVDAVWRPGFRIRQVDGAGQAFLWSLPAPPEDEAGLAAWRSSTFRGLVFATLKDGTGAFVDQIDAATIETALSVHSGPRLREE